MSDYLVEPLNAPPAATPGVGVQAGVQGPVTYAQAVIVYGAGGISGIFIYSGTPTAGNLVGSWAASAGIDQFGNSYPAGLEIGESGVEPILITNAGGQGQIQFLNSGFAPGYIYGYASGSGDSQFASVAMISPINDVTGFGDAVQDTLNSSDSGSSSNPSANRVLTYSDANGVGHALYIGNNQGLYLPTVNNLAAVKPGTGTSNTNAAFPEQWNAVNLASGWSAVGNGIFYRLQPDSNTVLVVGGATRSSFSTTTQLSSGALPSAYRPINPWNIGGCGIPGRAGAEIGTNGIISAVPNGTPCTEVDISGVYPLTL
jgi:hypothetical protein